ncbi:heme peroxidase [Crassisporium funariophilum]|nr:heme peroxidase [Crassisporium funariophilum]
MRLALRPALASSVFLLYSLIGSTKGFATFKWPDHQLAFVDRVLYEGSRFGNLTPDCRRRTNTTVAAQWIRIAYHDMSTHDVTDGSGGLDASILFELNRTQNIGRGMRDSLNDINFFTSPYVGLADMIAMGAVLAVESCGGPIIPYRAGRIDAKVAGPATVPEPQQDLPTHIELFRRQGFNQAEMIALVACGHTLGGVRRDDFPEIVYASEFADFDGTLSKFDNTVVTEYLDDTTTNPLIKSANVTTQSDLRIFSSDQNVTMQSIASPEKFSQTCGTLFERMINTVPKEVKLTEPVDPIENKVWGVSLIPQNGSYLLRVNLRRLSANPSRTVTLFWKEHHTQGSGSLCPPAGCVVNSTAPSSADVSSLGKSIGLKGFVNYRFNTEVPLSTSISRFWFSVDENDGSGPKIVDNGGSEYVIDQDAVLFDPSKTEILHADFPPAVKLVVGVRTSDIDSSDTFKLSIESYLPGTSDFIPIIQTVDLQQDTQNPPADGYTFFTGIIKPGVTAIHINAVFGGKTFRQYIDENDYFYV